MLTLDTVAQEAEVTAEGVRPLLGRRAVREAAFKRGERRRQDLVDQALDEGDLGVGWHVPVELALRSAVHLA